MVYKRMQRKRQFTDLTGYKGDRLILGFYYYINEDKIGNRDEGWLMMAHDKIPEVRP